MSYNILSVNDSNRSTYNYSKVNLNKEYIPLFCIPTIAWYDCKIDERFNNLSQDRKTLLEPYYNHPSKKYLLQSSYNYYYQESEDIINQINLYKPDFEQYVNEELTEFNLALDLSNTWERSYVSMFKHTNQHGWYRQTIRDYDYLIGKSMIAFKPYGTNNKWTILFCMMIRKEAVKYYKQCVVLDQQPIGEAFEMWVHPRLLDKKESINEGFRKQYVKHIGKTIDSKNITVRGVEDIWSEILMSISKPAFKTIRQEKQWLLDCTRRYLASVKQPTVESINLTTYDVADLREAGVIPESLLRPNSQGTVPVITGTGGSIDSNGTRIQEIFYNAASVANGQRPYSWGIDPISSSPGIGSQEFTVNLERPYVNPLGNGIIGRPLTPSESFPISRVAYQSLTREMLDEFIQELEVRTPPRPIIDPVTASNPMLQQAMREEVERLSNYYTNNNDQTQSD